MSCPLYSNVCIGVHLPLCPLLTVNTRLIFLLRFFDSSFVDVEQIICPQPLSISSQPPFFVLTSPDTSWSATWQERFHNLMWLAFQVQGWKSPVALTRFTKADSSKPFVAVSFLVEWLCRPTELLTTFVEDKSIQNHPEPVSSRYPTFQRIVFIWCRDLGWTSLSWDRSLCWQRLGKTFVSRCCLLVETLLRP